MTVEKGLIILMLLMGFSLSAKDLTFTPFNFPGSPQGMNNPGEIVGTSTGDEFTSSILLSPSGSVAPVTDPGASNTYAYGINNPGDIVGSVTLNGTHGFVGRNDDFSLIDVPDLTATVVRGINNPADMVGYARDSTGHQIGFLLVGSQFTFLMVPGSSGTFPYRINNHRQVAGYFLDADGHAHGFRFEDDTYEQMDVPGATDTFIYGLNNHGDVVGSFIDSLGTHGFVNSGGMFTAFDAPGSLPSFGTFARDISDSGNILVEAFGVGAFIAHAYKDDAQIAQ